MQIVPSAKRPSSGPSRAARTAARRRSPTRASTSSATSISRATSRCRSSATRTAARTRSASASAACSAGTRRSSRRRRRPRRSSPARPGEARRRALLRGGAARREAAWGISARARASSSRTRAGELFFLEVNARLQVEHPVTEMVTGLDLVELQLRVAAGEALPDLSGVVAQGLRDRGARVRRGSEQGVHPEAGRRSTSWCGRAGRARRRRSTLRVESGVRAGSKVTPFYDPMIAKVVAWGETRDGRDRRAAIARSAGRRSRRARRTSSFLRERARGARVPRRDATTRGSPRPSRSAVTRECVPAALLGVEGHDARLRQASGSRSAAGRGPGGGADDHDEQIVGADAAS